MKRRRLGERAAGELHVPSSIRQPNYYCNARAGALRELIPPFV